MNVRRFSMGVAAVVVGLAGLLAVGNSLRACEPACYYQRIVTYVCREQPYDVCVTRYDHCGRAYHVYVTKYRTVEVPVVKWVKVCR